MRVLLLLSALCLGAAGGHDAGANDPLPQESGLPGLAPGGTITLSAPSSAAQLAQASTGDPVTGVGDETTPGTRTDVEGERIGARARSLTPFVANEARVYRYWEIEVSSRPSDFLTNRTYDTVLQAQISGSLSLRGFLFVVGYGKASVSVDLTLYDLGTEASPNDQPKPIYGANLASREIDPKLGLGMEVGFGIEGGAPYIGASGEYAVGFDTPLEVDLVREELNFGFQSLLQRGHRYRVQIDLTTFARQAGTPGMPSASFFMGGRMDPDNRQLAQVDPTSETENAELGDFLDPDFWMDGVNALLDGRFPQLEARGLKAFYGSTPRFFFPEVTVDLFGTETTWGNQYVSLDNFPSQFLPTLLDTNDILGAVSDIEIPRSIEQAIRDRLATRGSTTQSKERDTVIDRPGLEFPHGITVTLATDMVEEVALLLKGRH